MSSPTYRYYYDQQWQIVEERYAPLGGTVQSDSQYVWSLRSADSPIVRKYDNNHDGTDDTISYYSNDAQGNVTAMINAGTGEIVDHYVYTAYGKVTVYSSVNPATPEFDAPLYCGYWYDHETGLYQDRNRYYDPVLSNFISRDPIGYSGGTSNLYVYCGNNPVNSTDPMGLANLWNPLTWGISNPSQSWWGFLNPVSSESLAAMGGAARGTVTGGKAIVNAGSKTVVSTVTLGFYESGNLINPTAEDYCYGYGYSEASARIAGELGTGLLTGGASKLGKLGKAVTVFDAAGNVVNTGRGVSGLYNEGVTVENVTNTVGGVAGLSGNVAGAYRGLPKAPTKLAFGLWSDAEAYLAKLHRGAKTQVSFATGLGPRTVDVLANKVAHECKLGYTSLTAKARNQIAKDAWLVKNRPDQITEVVWDFFRGTETGRIGATHELLEELRENGIKYVIHE